MKQKLAAIISLIALTFIITLASCAPISENTGEDSSQITNKLPPIASYSIRALTTEQVSRLQRETAKYRVTFSGAGQTITREGDGTSFSATFPTGAQVGVTVYCLNTKGEVIVKTVTKNITISSGANSLSFKLSEDAEEIEVDKEDPPQPVPGTVTYDGGTGVSNVPSDTQTYEIGSEVTLQTGEPTRAGYDFAGWSETEGAASATYKTGANTIQSVTKDYTLYAVWARTVLYEGGLFVINELPANRRNDVGVTQEYAAMKDDGSNYVFSFDSYSLWYDNKASITSVKIGSNISPTSTAIWFYGMSNCTSMNLTNLDTSNVTTMVSMFESCSGLTSLDLSNFNTSNVTTMDFMFYNCSGLTSLDVSKFDTSNVTNMQGMFQGCSGLTSLSLSNFDTSNVTDVALMFYHCSGLTSLNLSNFDTSNVTNVASMFDGCSRLTSLGVSSFNTSNVTNMNSMFYNCSGLTSLDLGNFDTSNVTNIANMFRSCSGLTSLDLSKFDTSNVTAMVSMFESCSGLTSLDLSSFDTSNVTYMDYLFDSCSKLTTIYASNSFVTDSVTISTDMFKDCIVLVGGKGCQFSSHSPTDKTYAIIDNPPDEPGYFTAKP